MNRHFMGMHRATNNPKNISLREIPKSMFVYHRIYFSTASEEDRRCFKTGFWHTWDKSVYDQLITELLKE